MQICAKHWAAIRAALDARGLTPFIAKSGEEAAARMQRMQEDGEETKDTFEPLMGCNQMLMEGAIRMGGLAVINTNDCPVCMAMKAAANCPCGKSHSEAEIEKHWTVDVADCALARAKELGLVLDVA